MATTTQAPTQTAVGTITGVGEANQGGFANVKLEMASGDLWLSTKSPGLIAVARNKKGDYVAVDYVTQESKNISTKTGRPFINHYIQAIREPAAEELPTTQYGDDDIPFGQSEPTPLEVTMQQEIEALGGAPGEPLRTLVTHGVGNGTSSQDEFRRSKEEMRWTEALHIAAVLLAHTSPGMEHLRRAALDVNRMLQSTPRD